MSSAWPTTSPTSWICAQLGAREHYAVPRALHSLGALEGLITEFWTPSSGLVRNAARGRLAGRFAPGLDDAHVVSGGIGWYATEAALRLRHSLFAVPGWGLILARNERFDRMAARRIAGLLDDTRDLGRPALFSYSYACSRILALGRKRGCVAVMGQIDGGPAEEDIVLREKALYPELHELYEPAPGAYWEGWRRQCDAASRIIVNSPWAKSCLENAGIDARKMAIVPVHYEPPQSARHADRLPDRFKASRPLRVLFLGQLNLRKGAARLFEAVRLLRGEPIEFNVVGPASVQIPPSIRAQENFKYFGAVTRTDAGRYYGAADVFILPTLSDGFAITQLEAQAHALPVIASRFCGQVVTHGLNGLLLSEVTGEAIADCLRGVLAEPGQLARMREHSGRAFATLRDYGMRFIEATCS